MGVVGVVLGMFLSLCLEFGKATNFEVEEGDVTNLYSSKSVLEEIYDKLENLSQSPFISSAEQDGERDKVLDEVWETYRADKVRKLETAIDEGKENELDRVHKLITERGRVPVSGFI